MDITINLHKNFALAVLAISIFSCSSGPVIQEFPNTASATEEVVKLDHDIQVALNEQVNVLSPTSFKEVVSSQKEAHKSLDKQEDAKDTLHLVAEGRAYLNRSNKFAVVSHKNIEDVIIAREQAISAKAPSLFTSDFKKADEELKEVTRDIENNNLKSAAAKRSFLQLAYLDLELKSIKHEKLDYAQKIVAQSVKEGAEDFAPQSLAIANKSILDADAFITANRHDVTNVNQRARDADIKAEHLLKITRDAKSGKKTSPEVLALRMEREENKVIKKENEIINSEIQLKNKQDQLDNSRGQIVKGLNANIALSDKNSSLESKNAFNKSFEEAQNEFSPSEAEVYKQGNTLTIRLRGLEFPVSKAELAGSNFPLLAKVQKVIKGFGKSSVIVEGYTDSTGVKAFNQELSSNRAKAVREYLLANGTGDMIRITAVGHGEQKPLASNKTASGRAQNRRVDILIHPETNKDSL